MVSVLNGLRNYKMSNITAKTLTDFNGNSIDVKDIKQSGAFLSGLTITKALHDVMDIQGRVWQWRGTLPKSVLAGSVPSPVSDNAWKLVSSPEGGSGGTPSLEKQAKIYNTFKQIEPYENCVLITRSFYANGEEGGAHYYYDPAISKSNHNGVTIYSPEAIAQWDGSIANIETLINWRGTGLGCYVRLEQPTSSKIGCNTVKSTELVKALFSNGYKVLLIDNDITFEKQTTLDGDISFVGMPTTKIKPTVQFKSSTDMRGLVSNSGTVHLSNLKIVSGGITDQVVCVYNKSKGEFYDLDFDWKNTTAALSGLAGGVYGENCNNFVFARNTFKNAWRDKAYNAGSAGGFGGNNLARSINIVNTSANYNISFMNNEWEDVWSAVYVSNTSDLTFFKNKVKNTADSGFFDRCTSGYSRNKMFLFNEFYMIGKAAIKTLDTNNVTATSHADDALVFGNYVRGWGLFIESECVLCARGYDSGYVWQNLKNKNLQLISNRFDQVAETKTKRVFLFINLEDPVIKDNTINIVADDATNEIYLMQWCRGGNIDSNTITCSSKLFLTYQHEGTLKTTNNKFTVGQEIVISHQRSGLKQYHILENNEIVNKAAAGQRHFGLLFQNVVDNCALRYIGNHHVTNEVYNDGGEATNNCIIGLSYDMPILVDNNTVEYADRFAFQKSIAGDILYPVYYSGTRGAAKIDAAGNVLFKVSGDRIVTKTLTST